MGRDPRAYALTAVSSVSLPDGERGWPLTNEDIREDLADDDPDATCAAVEIGVFGAMAVYVSAADAC